MTTLVKTPITIITGFLGSGKTSLIRSILEGNHSKKLAVLVNEFGDVGVDGSILKTCTDENCPIDNIVELANGCLCCTVADDFIPTIEQLLALPQKPDHILIETSGLALPKPLLQAFNWPAIKSRITVDAVITLVDADAVSQGRFAHNEKAVYEQALADDALDHETPLSELFDDQLACADLVLMTKSDLVDSEKLDAVKKTVEQHSVKKLPILTYVSEDFDLSILLDVDAKAEDDLETRPSHHDGHHSHEHDDFDTVIIELPEQETVQAVEEKIRTTAQHYNLLRVKGYVAIKDKPMRLLVQAVGDRVRTQFDAPWPKNVRQGQLVVIAEHDNINAETLKTAF